MNGRKATIREYLSDDLESVMGVWLRANALAHPFLAEAYVAQVEREIRDLYVPSAETYVLEEEGRVIGFIALLESEIGGLFVDPSKHGMGYGKALVDHAFAIKGPLSVAVFRENEIGRRFYERYGFEFVADERHEPSGRVSREMAIPGWLSRHGRR
jgi:putative acetyltransferase